MAVNRRNLPPHLYERYGIRPRRTGWLIVAATAAGSLLVSGLWLIGTDIAAGGATTLISWQAQPGNAEIRWSVYRADGQPVWCAIRAQDEKRFDIGFAVARVQETAELQSFLVTLNTRGEAFAVPDVVCEPSGPDYLVGPHFRPGLLPPPQGGGLAAPWQPEPDWLKP